MAFQWSEHPNCCCLKYGGYCNWKIPRNLLKYLKVQLETFDEDFSYSEEIGIFHFEDGDDYDAKQNFAVLYSSNSHRNM